MFKDDKTHEKLKKAVPEGAKYIGTYFVIDGTAEHDVEMIYEMENWGTMDKFRNFSPLDDAQNEMVKVAGGWFVVWQRSKFLRTAKDVQLRGFD